MLPPAALVAPAGGSFSLAGSPLSPPPPLLPTDCVTESVATVAGGASGADPAVSVASKVEVVGVVVVVVVVAVVVETTAAATESSGLDFAPVADAWRSRIGLKVVLEAGLRKARTASMRVRRRPSKRSSGRGG